MIISGCRVALVMPLQRMGQTLDPAFAIMYQRGVFLQ